jgi:hypothetical protein
MEGVDEPGFDFEAALNLLGLQARLAGAGADLGDDPLPLLARRLGERFCTSRASTEMLCAAVAGEPSAVAAVKDAHAQVTHHSEQAMNHALAGDPGSAVRQLLRLCDHSGNARYAELAAQVARRHQSRIEDAPALLGKAEELLHRWGRPLPHLAGLRRSQRAVGGLVLRLPQGTRGPRKARPGPFPAEVA